MKPLTTLLFLALLGGTPSAYAQDSTDLRIGKIEWIESNVLHELRRINVALPVGYHPDSLKTYPVVYVLDGSMHEDFIHVVGLYQFMALTGAMEPSIVVGISNVDRQRDFTFPTTIKADSTSFPTTGKSAAFIQFIQKELIPFIDKHYKINGHRTIVGQSLGGLLASEILIHHPETFEKYIIVSPSFWWNNESLLKDAELLWKKGMPAKEVQLSVGKEHPVMVRDAKKFAALMKKHVPSKDLVRFHEFKDEDHATILHEAIYRSLKPPLKK